MAEGWARFNQNAGHSAGSALGYLAKIHVTPPGPQVEGPSNNIQTPRYFPTQLEGIRPYFLFVYRLG